jgi:ribonucleoside-diphosphate reductase beta chain
VRRERPDLFDARFNERVVEMLREAVGCARAFFEDTLGMGITGLSVVNMREYLQYVADQRLVAPQIPPIFGSKNPFDFMELQDVQELTNFSERRVSACHVAVAGEVAFSDDF